MVFRWQNQHFYKFCISLLKSGVIENDVQVYIIYTDLSKVFAGVDHCSLEAEVLFYGFVGKVLHLLKSYLFERTQIEGRNFQISDGDKPSSTGQSFRPAGFCIKNMLLKFSIFSRRCSQDAKVIIFCFCQNEFYAIFQRSIDKKLPLNIDKCSNRENDKTVSDFDYYLDNKVFAKTTSDPDLELTFAAD